MVRSPSSSSVRGLRLPFAELLSADGKAERRAGVRCVAGLCGRKVAEQECSGYGCGRLTAIEHRQFTSARQEPRPPEGDFAGTTELVLGGIGECAWASRWVLG